ncbi:Crp/Fnr family transcriptional regulator [Acetobacter ghanensis]|uniref:CRP/FNR family transcriptional regulator n=2 Tax=Acetobacter ghanensis TaxID=431306 RepID=A0A0U5F097_9PROT|nr:helix-turn-helix domain-containing protein [Acetobacter ghanensis]CEF53730.1 CRP/FNR family transcriptional regulator [Acetobacter ghanensis]
MTSPSRTSAFAPLGGVAHASKADMDVMRCLVCDIRNRSLCNSMDEEGLAALAHSSRQLLLPPGTTIVEEGEPALAFFNVTRGTVKLFKSLPDGRRQITGFADAGQFLGLSTAQTYSFGAETVDNVRLCRFMRPQLETLLTDYPSFERRLLAAVTDKLAEAQEQMLLLGRKTAREKVASFLLDRMKAFHQTANRRQEAETLASVPMTRVDIADYLGLTIETVSRTISAFRRSHLIASAENHRIRILSVPTLTNIASGQKAE